MQKTTKEKFYVTMHVMPYVQRYMMDMYGVRDERIKNLVNASRDPMMMAAVMPRLRKRPLSNSFPSDARRPVAFPRSGEGMDEDAIAKRRTAILNIEISGETFERQGWALSPKDESAVALLLERRCQGLLLAFLQADYLITGDLAQSIQHFYRTFHQTEDTWPTDSIRKIWNRNIPANQRKTLHGLLEREITCIFEHHLVRAGLIRSRIKV